MIYLGAMGRLVPIRCATSQAMSHGDRYSTMETLEGRVKAQVRPVRRREWSVGFGDLTTAEDASRLLEFAEGAWGPGPFRFVPSEAPTTNMLTPGQSTCDPQAGINIGAGQSAAGPMMTPDGLAPRSISNPSPLSLLQLGFADTPVIPGQVVTASAYVLGNRALAHLYFYDASGQVISDVRSAEVGTVDAVVRASVTTVAPEHSVTARVYARRAVQATRPALTWTDKLLPWSIGRGCEKAVVREVSENLVYVRPDRMYENMAFTVTEVG